MEERKILYLSRADVEAAGVTMAEIIEAVEAAFREKGEGRVEIPPKTGLHSMSDAFINAMPAYIPAKNSIGVKWVSAYPQNRARGLPYISGLLILNDPETGIPTCVMDCAWITAKRTAAASAVAAKYLARPNSQSLGVLGAGVQGFSHLEAIKTLFPIRRVVVYDVVPAQAKRYAERAAELWSDLEIAEVSNPKAAVAGLDIVVTAGPVLKKPHATIKPGWMTPGAFATAVDYDSYWDPAAMAEVSKFVTDDLRQLEYHKTVGYFQNIPPVYAELGELVTGRKPGRENDSEITMAVNLGLAICDMATAPLVYRKAVEKGLGIWLPL
jgi:ornithine cyclodeaminase/alanine dehydrogenase-like protein (mu-crystallin family)